jgi:hypothetical protein
MRNNCNESETVPIPTQKGVPRNLFHIKRTETSFDSIRNKEASFGLICKIAKQLVLEFRLNWN